MTTIVSLPKVIVNELAHALQELPEGQRLKTAQALIDEVRSSARPTGIELQKSLAPHYSVGPAMHNGNPGVIVVCARTDRTILIARDEELCSMTQAVAA